MGKRQQRKPFRKDFAPPGRLWAKEATDLYKQMNGSFEARKGRVTDGRNDFAPVWPLYRNTDMQQLGKRLAASLLSRRQPGPAPLFRRKDLEKSPEKRLEEEKWGMKAEEILPFYFTTFFISEVA
jgi:hypothetical protein